MAQRTDETTVVADHLLEAYERDGFVVVPDLFTDVEADEYGRRRHRRGQVTHVG